MIACAAALAVAFVGVGGNANPFEEPIPSKVGLAKPEKLLKLVSKPGLASLSNCDSNNPADVGGTVTVTKGSWVMSC